jgi:hypothetical protein
MKVAVQYGEKMALPKVALGEGLVGYAALHREAVLVPDVSKDPRYIKVLEDVRSSWRFRCCSRIAASASLTSRARARRVYQARRRHPDDAGEPGGGRHRERAALRRVSANEARLEKELGFAKRVQAALSADAAAQAAQRAWTWPRSSRPRASWAAISTTFLMPESTRSSSRWATCPARACRPRCTACSPASSCAAARSGAAFSRSDRPGARAHVDQHHPARAPLEEYYCTLCYAVFDIKRKTLTMSNSGLPYPCDPPPRHGLIELPGVPLGAFVGVNYDDVSFPLHAGDVFVFCSDGVVGSR